MVFAIVQFIDGLYDSKECNNKKTPKINDELIIPRGKNLVLYYSKVVEIVAGMYYLNTSIIVIKMQIVLMT
jgi:hypothetical protein